VVSDAKRCLGPVARGGDEGQFSFISAVMCSTVWIAGSLYLPVMGWDVDATLVIGNLNAARDPELCYRNSVRVKTQFSTESYSCKQNIERRI
jgi:hypothetical protein